MDGIVATQDVPAYTYVGTYMGLEQDAFTRDAFLKRIEEKYGVKAVIHHARYDCGVVRISGDTVDGETRLVPVDGKGNVLPQFVDNPCLYVNEASAKGEYPNVVRAFNLDTGMMDFVTIRALTKGDELLTYYGGEYGRDYELVWTQGLSADNIREHTVALVKDHMFHFQGQMHPLMGTLPESPTHMGGNGPLVAGGIKRQRK